MVDQKHTVSADTRAMMEYQSRSKSTGVAYLLWFFLGAFGVHRFYLGSTGVGALMAISTLLSLILIFTIFVTILIALYDLFTIPSQIRKFNQDLMNEVGG